MMSFSSTLYDRTVEGKTRVRWRTGPAAMERRFTVIGHPPSSAGHDLWGLAVLIEKVTPKPHHLSISGTKKSIVFSPKHTS